MWWWGLGAGLQGPGQQVQQVQQGGQGGQAGRDGQEQEKGQQVAMAGQAGEGQAGSPAGTEFVAADVIVLAAGVGIPELSRSR